MAKRIPKITDRPLASVEEEMTHYEQSTGTRFPKETSALPRGLTQKTLKKLFRILCAYVPVKEGIVYQDSDPWIDCDKCILCDVPCGDKTLCLAIWKDGILDD